MKAEDVLLGLWKEFRNGCTATREGEFIAVLRAFVQTDDITIKQALFYRQAIKVCPGHEDEGGRTWCAYCGNLNEKSARVHPDGGTTIQKKAVPVDEGTTSPIKAEDAIAE